MLKLNHKLNQGKNQLIGQFKLPYSLNGPAHNRTKWFEEKNTKQVEYIIGHLFINYLRQVEKKKVMYFSQNENDGHMNPDLFVNTDGRLIGVQVTQFVIRDYISRYNQAKNICEKISNFISQVYKPPIKINIQICTPWDSDEIPKGREKLYKRMSKEIANSIEKNIEQLTTKNEFLNFNLNRTDFKEIAESYNLLPVPVNYQSNYFGNNNIYIDYGFDYVVIFEEDIEESAKKIYDDKNNGNSEILIIWGDQNQFLNTDEYIIKALEKKFTNTSFASVYYLGFQNLMEIKERNINYRKIK
ncbi:hypothetical protein [Maribacter sp. IgM3_T14_3]|uniref:hypothetical protein n=1 Tax=Maribacter sp. IgM3_T14_3 TaxID=3415140 RepID=UPI003C6F97F8